MTKQVVVTSNDPVEPRVVLTLTAHLVTVLELDPEYVDFGRVRPGMSAARSIHLSGRDAAKTHVVSATIDRSDPARPGNTEPIVVAQPLEGAAGGVELTIAPDAPRGRFYALVTAHTDHPEVGELKFRVVGEVGGGVRLRPDRLRFRSDGESGEQTRSISVRGDNGGRPVAVLGVDVEHPGLHATVSEEGPGNARVRVTFDGRVRSDRETTVLVVRTSDPDQPRIEVPVEILRLNPPPDSSTSREH